MEQVGRLEPQVDQIDERVKAALQDLGGRIRMARLLAGKTQENVALVADIDCKRYQHIEAGKANVTMKTLVRLCLAIGVDWIELLQSHPPSSLLGRVTASHPPCEAPVPVAEKAAP